MPQLLLDHIPNTSDSQDPILPPSYRPIASVERKRTMLPVSFPLFPPVRPAGTLIMAFIRRRVRRRVLDNHIDHAEQIHMEFPSLLRLTTIR